jgi:hypothetical protein
LGGACGRLRGSAGISGTYPASFALASVCLAEYSLSAPDEGVSNPYALTMSASRAAACVSVSRALRGVSDGRRSSGGQPLCTVRTYDRWRSIRTFDNVCDYALSSAWEYGGLEYKADKLPIAGRKDLAGNSLWIVLDHARVRQLPPFDVDSQSGSNLSVATVCGGWY